MIENPFFFFFFVIIIIIIIAKRFKNSNKIVFAYYPTWASLQIFETHKHSILPLTYLQYIRQEIGRLAHYTLLYKTVFFFFDTFILMKSDLIKKLVIINLRLR